MATQIKPASSGSYTEVTLTDAGCCDSSSAGLDSVPALALNVALNAINEWVNAAGEGSHAGLAAAKLGGTGIGLLIREV